MVLVIVLWIVLGLSTVVLLFAESSRMEYRVSANGNAAIEADQAIEGARRYLSFVLDNYAAPGMLPESDTFEVEDVPIGEASFWVIGRPEETLADADTPQFGLVDEASKLNLNTATREMMEMLPNMTPEVAAAILDWRNPADEPQPDGAESQAYAAGDPAYLCKNAPFESVEELRLVKGVTPELLYGADTNRNGILDPDEQEDDNEMDSTTSFASSAPLMLGSSTWRGLLDFVTVWSREPNMQTNGLPRINVRRAKNQELVALLQERLGGDRAAQIQAAADPHATSIRSVLEFYVVGGVTATEAPQIEDALTASSGPYIVGRVNVNTAPREVLVCLPGIGEKYADTLIATRKTKAPEDLESIAWIMEVLDTQSAVLAGPYITARSYQVSADIAAVGRHGRALRRSWMVLDTLESKSLVIYRCDQTHLGWPLGVQWREALDSLDHLEGQGNSRSPQKAGKEAT